ncbi:MAG: lipopolysaccharide heptosyltransferase family protein [Bradyrhizobium sp.]|uniref:glycosyltransferase family 9 protein n=1 Tax=Bradyrhizobium sp. TaxID=376 RepID=UPI00121B947F|nr:glycosyltransferase family 9 protein [Bradyrhizobium sp.]THD62649.1 MAG: lipopolysaccharide heptosyltransferase family protein [Bradyrhizobium sp.]
MQSSLSQIDRQGGESSGSRPIAVLVEREGLGDVLLKLPMLRTIAKGFPGRPIWWIAGFQTSMADDLRPYLRDLVSEVRPSTGISSRRPEMVRGLRELPPFSLVFDTRTRWESIGYARHVLKRDRYYCCTPGYVGSDARPSRFTRPRHIGARALSLAEAALGAPANGEGALACGTAAREMVAKLLPAGPVYVGVAVGSREARKNWPLHRFGELALALASRGRVPVLLLGPQEASSLEEIRNTIPQAIALDFMQIRPEPAIGVFDAAIAVIERLRLVVANDGGLGHLAGAVARPVVSLFGPTDPRRWAPMAPALAVVRAQDHGGDGMDAIPMEPVLAAVETLLRQ